MLNEWPLRWFGKTVESSKAEALAENKPPEACRRRLKHASLCVCAVFRFFAVMDTMWYFFFVHFCDVFLQTNKTHAKKNPSKNTLVTSHPHFGSNKSSFRGRTRFLPALWTALIIRTPSFWHDLPRWWERGKKLKQKIVWILQRRNAPKPNLLFLASFRTVENLWKLSGGARSRWRTNGKIPATFRPLFWGRGGKKTQQRPRFITVPGLIENGSRGEGSISIKERNVPHGECTETVPKWANGGVHATPGARQIWISLQLYFSVCTECLECFWAVGVFIYYFCYCCVPMQYNFLHTG